jgi:hypothetical protein
MMVFVCVGLERNLIMKFAKIVKSTNIVILTVSGNVPHVVQENKQTVKKMDAIYVNPVNTATHQQIICAHRAVTEHIKI